MDLLLIQTMISVAKNLQNRKIHSVETYVFFFLLFGQIFLMRIQIIVLCFFLVHADAQEVSISCQSIGRKKRMPFGIGVAHPNNTISSVDRFIQHKTDSNYSCISRVKISNNLTRLSDLSEALAK